MRACGSVESGTVAYATRGTASLWELLEGLEEFEAFESFE